MSQDLHTREPFISRSSSFGWIDTAITRSVFSLTFLHSLSTVSARELGRFRAEREEREREKEPVSLSRKPADKYTETVVG